VQPVLHHSEAIIRFMDGVAAADAAVPPQPQMLSVE